jgi:26S proteasome regulatory subunit T5
MSSQPPNPPVQPPNNEKAPEASSASSSTPAPADAAMNTAPDQPAEETWDDIPEDIMVLPTDEILTRVRLLDNDIKVCAYALVQEKTTNIDDIGYEIRNDTPAA